MGFFRLMGIVPLGIGLTVLGFLWLSPFGEFHSPPLFFRVFGSFIALGFVLMGSGLLFNLMPTPADQVARMARSLDLQNRKNAPHSPNAPGTAFSCSNCGAALGDDADVSPNGDVKCLHCRTWFNIHRPVV